MLGLFWTLLTASCDQPWTLARVLDGTAGEPLSLSPNPADLLAGEELTFSAGGGIPFEAEDGSVHYRFAIVEGGGEIDSVTGAYTAPAVAGSATVSVTDLVDNVVEASVTIVEALSLEPAQVELYFNESQSFGPSGGSPPYEFELTGSGSGSPTVDAQTGEYTAGDVAGTDIVTVTDSAGRTVSAAISVLKDPITVDVDYVVQSVTHTAGTDVGGPVQGELAIENLGTDGGTATVNWRVVASTDMTLDVPADPVIAAGSIEGLLAGGSSEAISFDGLWPAVANEYYLLAHIAASDDVNGGNNTDTSVLVTITGVAPTPDVNYLASDLSVTSSTAGAGAAGTFDISNVGTDTGYATLAWTLFVSTDATFDANTDRVVSVGTTTALDAGGVVDDLAFVGTWHEDVGAYNLFLSVSASDENDTTDNVLGPAAVTLVAKDIDYVADTWTVATPVVAGSAISDSFVIRNRGTFDGSTDVSWTVYASADATIDVGTDRIVASGSTSPLSADDSTDGSGTDETVVDVGGTWTEPPGTYHFIARLSNSEDVAAGNDSDNDEASPGVTVTAPDVDYGITTVPAGGFAIVSSAVSETFAFENTGADAGSSSVFWYAYQSLDTEYQDSDALMDSGSIGGLAAGATSGAITVDGTWPSTSGTYYIIVRVQSGEDVDATDNIASSSAFDISAGSVVDNVPLSLTSTYGTVLSGSTINESFVVKNTGTLPGNNNVGWTLYLSTDQIRDGTDQAAATGSIGPLAGGATSATIYPAGNWISAGTYYLIVEIDDASGDDGDTGNNTIFAGPFTVNDPPDYTVVGEADAVSPAMAGSTLTSATFRIKQVTDNPGTAPVSWKVRASRDVFPSGDDFTVNSGSVGPLDVDDGEAEGPDEVLVDVGGMWPSSGGRFYLIVSISSIDDFDPSSNVFVSPTTYLVYTSVENEDEVGTNNDGVGPTAGEFAGGDGVDYQHVGNLGTSDDYWIQGQGDAVEGDGNAEFDTYRFVVSGGVATVFAEVVWATGGDIFDLRLWDTSSQELTSSSLTAGREPSAGGLGWNNSSSPAKTWSDGETVYVSVEDWDDGTGGTDVPYLLHVWAE